MVILIFYFYFLLSTNRLRCSEISICNTEEKKKTQTKLFLWECVMLDEKIFDERTVIENKQKYWWKWVTGLNLETIWSLFVCIIIKLEINFLCSRIVQSKEVIRILFHFDLRSLIASIDSRNCHVPLIISLWECYELTFFKANCFPAAKTVLYGRILHKACMISVKVANVMFCLWKAWGLFLLQILSVICK